MKVCLLVTFLSAVLASEDDLKDRRAKVLPVFQVVRFPNDPCIVTGGSKNGTCYTTEECSTKGGTNAGSCAEGFGVCCTFSLGCGSTTSENMTYFESGSTVNSGACRAKICKCNSNICQMRLDFDSFVISGPSTATTSNAKALNGDIGAGGKEINEASRCLTDTFSVSNQRTFPLICGTNSGYHAYFEASDACNYLDFQFGNVANGVSTIASRTFSIRITQYSCDYDNLAPAGCDQYFFGATTNQMASYNFAGGRHLANQKQTVCIRREAGNCRICYHAAAADIGLTKDTNIPGIVVKGEICCAYGTDGKQIDNAGAYDCLMIPGARDTASALKPVSLCGVGVGLVTAAGTTAKTVCSKAYPFRVNFLSDGFEMAKAAMDEAMGGIGFRIRYWQTSC